MLGVSTFSVAMVLLKWLPLKMVDKFLLLVAHFTLGNTTRVGLRRPKTGPLELKNATGKSPVLDVGALSLIQTGKIEVYIYLHTKTQTHLSPSLSLTNKCNGVGSGRSEGDNEERGEIHRRPRARVRLHNSCNGLQEQRAELAQGKYY